jgi:hypothetical protein
MSKMLHNLFRQFTRDKSLLFWVGLAGLLISLSVFMASTLLLEQKTAAFVYGRFILHWHTTIGLIVWGASYFARLRQSREMLFWLTLPVSRLQLLINFALVFNLIAFSMIFFSTFLLWIFTTPPFELILQFILASGFEAMTCATLIVFFSFSLQGNLKAPFAVVIVLILGHTISSFERSLDAPFLSTASIVDIWLIKILEAIAFISPRFDSTLTLSSFLQTTGFTFLTGLLCHTEFSRQSY